MQQMPFAYVILQISFLTYETTTQISFLLKVSAEQMNNQ